MSKRTKDELLSALRGVLGDNQSDEAIELIEDITDTFEAPAEDWEQKFKDNDAAWRQKFKDNDAAWRQKYTVRFFAGDVDQGDGGNTETVIESGETEKNLTYDELFEEG